MANIRFGALALVLAAGVAQAAVLDPGVYRLLNHTDGTAQPPRYGLRLDELVNVTSGWDYFTFDFEAAGSDVRMDLSANSIRIFGTVFGGRDAGNDYANDQYRGFYNVDFTYSLGVTGAPGDDDIIVDAMNRVNTGNITGPVGSGINQNLVDERGSFPFSFRLGNEVNDLGHRGWAGVSGWGWLSYANSAGVSHVDASDWLFIVGPEIPAPASAMTLGLAGLLAARRRR